MSSSRTAHARKVRGSSLRFDDDRSSGRGPVDVGQKRHPSEDDAIGRGRARRLLSRGRSVAALVFVGVLSSVTGLGYLGGGRPLAVAVELHPECAEYDALVERCFARPSGQAGAHQPTLASKEVCIARTNQLKAVCR